jgi:hypothetical protein
VRALVANEFESDSATIHTPVYMVLTPKQGDNFRIGDTVRVRMKAAAYAKAGINLDFGPWELTPPGVTSTFNMQTAPEIGFVIPPAFVVQVWSDSLQKAVSDSIPPVYDSCFVKIFDYTTPSQIYAVSYGYFRITN